MEQRVNIRFLFNGQIFRSCCRSAGSFKSKLLGTVARIGIKQLHCGSIVHTYMFECNCHVKSSAEFNILLTYTEPRRQKTPYKSVKFYIQLIKYVCELYVYVYICP